MGISLLANDVQASVMARVERQTQQFRGYTPYGYLRPQPGRLGFAGQIPEITVGYLLGNGYRLYNPTLMRFCAPDSWSPFGEGGLNAFAYCENNPVNRVDPSGHIKVKRLAAAFMNDLIFHAVDAVKGNSIMENMRTGKKLSLFDATFAEIKARKALTFTGENLSYLLNAKTSAEQGHEGGKIIYDESKDYISDILTIQIMEQKPKLYQAVGDVKKSAESRDLAKKNEELRNSQLNRAGGRVV
ncbi:RHS repeat-associated core domain-containing protein [Pseudomonas sp. CAM1A]|uniref:RHS repeat-associated core domain-containing protein n=1 Tax=Pseudomonas sp. CAM1A TaxID=3231717 RepID=UPI0039C674C2